jgi:two-component system OmpR family sensor kinase
VTQRRPFLSRFHSLRWRLTFLYVGLLTVLLVLLGVGQYVAAREVLLRSNADVLTNDYKAVLQAFVRQQAALRAQSQARLPNTAATTPRPLRGAALLRAFAADLASRQISAAVFTVDGGLVSFQPATSTPDQPVVSLATADYLTAVIGGHPRPYYLAAAGAPPANNLVVLNLIRLSPTAKPVGIAQLSIPTADIDRTLTFDRLIAITGSLVVLLLALLLSPLIVGRALRPLEHMSASAGAMAAGDYSQRVPVPPAGDEIGELAAAFNQMAAGVDQAFQMRRQSEERMRQFVADASHELRTPLTAIAGYLDVLSRRETVDPETLRSSLAAMQGESGRMTRLVNDLLTLARFESGRAPALEPTRLEVFLNQTLDELQLEEQGVPVVRRLQPGITVRADADALKRVIQNLAQNAVKYAPGAEQRWSCFAQDGRAGFQVEDSGPGISPRDLPHVFERFYRGEKARDRSTGGSGLGLAIARSIVEAHGGSIEAHSPPGEGAIFTVWLPLAAESAPEQPARPARSAAA